MSCGCNDSKDERPSAKLSLPKELVQLSKRAFCRIFIKATVLLPNDMCIGTRSDVLTASAHMPV